MLNKIKQFLLKNSAKILSLVLTVGTVYTVNSACAIGYGQIEEPESLKRFKKI